MNRTLQHGVTGALLLGAVAGLVAISTVRTSGPPVPLAANDFTISQPEGDVIITTDPGGAIGISFDPPGPAAPVPATVTVSRKCVVTVSNGPITLRIVGYQDAPGNTVGTEVPRPASAPASIGLVDNGIGSSDGKNCNTSNGLVESGHALAIELSSSLVSQGIKIDSASLDLEGKHGADLEAIMKDGSITTGTRWDPLGSPTSDNGCDAGPCDNHEVVLGTAGSAPDNFTKLVLAPVGGELALEGGGDHTAPSQNRSVLHLTSTSSYEYELTCDKPASGYEVVAETDADWPDDNNVTNLDPTMAEIFRYRGWEHNGGEYVLEAGELVPKPCGQVLANLDGDDETVIFDPSNDEAFLRVRLTWEIPVADVDEVGDSVFDRRIDIGDGQGFTAARSCDGFDPSGAGSGPASAFDNTDPGVADHTVTVGTSTEFLPWCVLSDSREVVGDVVVQTMVWDGLGDPRWA